MKGIAPLAIVAVLVVAGLLGAVAAVPGFGNSIASIVSGPKLCSETPFNGNCICAEGETRKPVQGQVIPRFFCESSSLMFDPDSSNFASLVAPYATQKLTELFPACDMVACSHPDSEWRIGWGYTDDYQRRSILAECWQPGPLGNRFSTIEVDAETGGVSSAGCASYADVVQDVQTSNPASLSLLPKSFAPDGVNVNGDSIAYYLSYGSKCGTDDNGVGTITLQSPFGVKATGWQVWKSPIATMCTIESTTDRSATIKCDSSCPHASFGAEAEVRAQFDPSTCLVQYDVQVPTGYGNQNKQVDSGTQACQRTLHVSGTTPIFTLNVVQCSSGQLTTVAGGVTTCDDSVQPAAFTGGSGPAPPAPPPIPQPAFSLPSFADQCISTYHNRYGSNQNAAPPGTIQWLSGANYCYSGALVASSGGCPATPVPDTSTASCAQLNVALGCGKISATAYKNAIVSRQMNCLPAN